MVKLACNYFEETKELVLENSIKIDYFKFPSLGFQMSIFNDLKKYKDFMENLNNVKPVLFHGLYPSDKISSSNFVDNLNVELVKKILDDSKTPGISIHLDADNNLSKEEVIKNSINNILFLKETFDNFEFISMENIEKKLSKHIFDPKIISEIIHETGINFLLDISHAFWAAKSRNEGFIEYIQKLPLEKIYEIHINGWTEKNGDMMSHIKVNDLGYSTLNYLFGFCLPEIVTLEYGRHNDRIGVGCPIMTPNSANDDAKEEIIEQISKLNDVINYK